MESNRLEVEAFLVQSDRIIDPAAVRVVLDIGSRDGQIALAMQSHYPNAEVFAFECNPAALDICRQRLAGVPRVTLEEYAVSDADAPLEFFAVDPERTRTTHPDGNIGASSLFQANPAYPYERYVQNRIIVRSVRLDSWTVAHHVRGLDVVWMDIQGAELRALVGMGRFLATVKVLYTEVEYKPVYLGQPLFAEVHGYLTAKGFLLCRTMNQGDWFANALYTRRHLWPRWLLRSVVARLVRLAPRSPRIR